VTDLTEFQRKSRKAHPQGFEPGIVWNPETGGTITAALDQEPDEAIWGVLIADWGLDPERTMVVPGSLQIRAWDAPDPEGGLRRLFYYRATLKPREANDDRADIEALCKMVMKRKPVSGTTSSTTRAAMVVLLADWQLGKGEGGGSEATIERIMVAQDRTLVRLKELRKVGRGVSTVYLVGLGDLVEQCSGHYCVSADTPVLTDDLRWVPAGELEAGDGLYAFNEHQQSHRGRKYEKATVLANKIEMMESVRVSFSDGRDLVCTPEHPLLTMLRGPHAKKSEWVSAADLKIGDRVAKICNPWQDPTTYDEGWMGGLYDGEGHFSAGSDRSGPNILGVSQKLGAVLDKARNIMLSHGFDFSEKINAKSNVATIKTRGGYAELLRALGTFRPVRLISKLGEPYMRSQWVEVVSIEDAGQQAIARLGTSSHTYFANGYASHNSMQAHQTDLDRREQMRLARRLILRFVDLLVGAGYKVVLGAVPGNHGENRNSAGKAYTTWTDNDDLAVFDGVAEVCAANPDRYSGVSVPLGAIAENLTMTLDIEGVAVGFAHGHQFGRGAGGSVSKIENWLKGQALGRQSIGDADILFSGHYHHFVCSESSGRTVFQSPASDGGSYWFTANTGANSPAGLLTLLIGEGCGARGWSDLAII